MRLGAGGDKRLGSRIVEAGCASDKDAHIVPSDTAFV
jgi:hypothetical protein